MMDAARCHRWMRHTVIDDAAHCHRSSRRRPVKPIDGFAARWDVLLDKAIAWDPAAHGGRPMRLVVVGGGAGGIELTLSMQARSIGLCDAQRFSVVCTVT